MTKILVTLFIVSGLIQGCGSQKKTLVDDSTLQNTAAATTAYTLTCRENLEGDSTQAARFAILEIDRLMAKKGKVTTGVGEAVPFSLALELDYMTLESIPPIDQYRAKLPDGSALLFEMQESIQWPDARLEGRAFFTDASTRETKSMECTVEQKAPLNQPIAVPSAPLVFDCTEKNNPTGTYALLKLESEVATTGVLTSGVSEVTPAVKTYPVAIQKGGFMGIKTVFRVKLDNGDLVTYRLYEDGLKNGEYSPADVNSDTFDLVCR